MDRKGILMALSLAGGLALLFVILGGCGSGNSQSPMIDANGKHPAAWLDRHWSEYHNDQKQCKSCHGNDLKGGIANLSCFNTNIGNRRCHANGPDGHSAGFIATHFVVFNSDREQCVVCHGSYTDRAAAGGVANVSCFSASRGTQNCHAYGPLHPAGFMATHYVVFNIDRNQCIVCHGSYTDQAAAGGVANVSCFSASLGTQICHASGPLHPAGFIDTHFVVFSNDQQQCVICHGSYTDAAASGGIANVSCFSASRGTQSCHAYGPLHPAGYAAPVLHGHLAKIDLVYCQQCHANYAIPPRFAIPKTNMQAGCESAGCHIANTAHPSPWLAGRGTPANTTSHINATAANLAISCGLCHGVSLTGGATAPSCMATTVNGIRCHSSSPMVNPTGCVSCHNNPPGGSIAPNRMGAHSKHNAIAGVAANCAVCHNGFIPDFTAGTPSHADGTTNVSISANTYMAKPALAPFCIGGVCSNVSCHGGKVTPVWGVGAINVNTECDMCHSSGTSQYNSYNSGWHTVHNITHSIRCWDCHDTAKLSIGHFINLATSTFEQHPKATLTFKDPVTGNILNASYNQSNNTYTCTFECHDSVNSTIKIHINITPAANQSWVGAP